MAKPLKRYKLGVDFTEEDYHRWKEQLMWWIDNTMPKVESPAEHAKKILLAAMNGTKLDGSSWPTISNDFYTRVRQLGAFDLKKGVGLKSANHYKQSIKGRTAAKTPGEELPAVDAKAVANMQENYKVDLLRKYPHLENPVYEPKVDELVETIVRGRLMAHEFMTADSKALERLSKIRESLNKQVNDLMNFLEISPKMLVEKQRATERADVGSLVAEMESYGEVWEDFERLDALRELLQKYKQINSLRPDGTPQLNDWEVWHMTRSRPIDFTCECGNHYTLLGGFTPEEIEEALIQAGRIYGFGLIGIEGDKKDDGTINTDILPSDAIDEPMYSVKDNIGDDE